MFFLPTAEKDPRYIHIGETKGFTKVLTFKYAVKPFLSPKPVSTSWWLRTTSIPETAVPSSPPIKKYNIYLKYKYINVYIYKNIFTIIVALGIFRGVGSSKNDLSFLASFVLKTKYEKFVKRLISTKINGEIMVNIKYISYIGRNFCKQCCNHFKISFFCQCSDQ